MGLESLTGSEPVRLAGYLFGAPPSDCRQAHHLTTCRWAMGLGRLTGRTDLNYAFFTAGDSRWAMGPAAEPGALLAYCKNHAMSYDVGQNGIKDTM